MNKTTTESNKAPAGESSENGREKSNEAEAQKSKNGDNDNEGNSSHDKGKRVIEDPGDSFGPWMVVQRATRGKQSRKALDSTGSGLHGSEGRKENAPPSNPTLAKTPTSQLNPTMSPKRVWASQPPSKSQPTKSTTQSKPKPKQALRSESGGRPNPEPPITQQTHNPTLIVPPQIEKPLESLIPKTLPANTHIPPLAPHNQELYPNHQPKPPNSPMDLSIIPETNPVEEDNAINLEPEPPDLYYIPTDIMMEACNMRWV
ncbi:hypothetical protein PIB30_084497 [Stylosanthes scabra]|uniref:Uncharacterized protein n=1 Tax=Stylosanthes scabra TaxID=79078 RepID=A0ABU6QTT9_9FABA|nr:hypothetical protein [Stylosanthes scabra]